MLKLGLTGSIAVGKSFVCSVLRDRGCHVLDADVTAREVVASGTEGFREVVKAFGPGVVGDDGELDRKALGEIVFGDRAKLDLLNSIIHPRVIAKQDEWISNLEQTDPDGIAVVDAALMIESGGYKRFNKLIVVWCEPDIQLRRLMDRNGLSEEEAKRRIASQMPQAEKKRYADHLIDTTRGFDDTRRQVDNLLKELEHRTTTDA